MSSMYTASLSWRPTTAETTTVSTPDSSTTLCCREISTADEVETSSVRVHMTHNSLFALDNNYALVCCVDGIGSECAAVCTAEQTFLNTLRESLHHMRSLKKMVHAVSAGESMVCFACETEVWTLGMNVLGDMSPSVGGEAKESMEVTPQLRQLSPRMRAVHMAVGMCHMLVVDDAGGLWAAGQGSSGELGCGRRVGFQSHLCRAHLLPPEDRAEAGDRGRYREAGSAGTGDHEEVEVEVEVAMRAVRVYAGAKVSVVVAQRHARRCHRVAPCGDPSSDVQGRLTCTEGSREGEVEECVYTFGSGAYFKLGHGNDVEDDVEGGSVGRGDDDELQPRCLLGLWRGGLGGALEVACGRFHMALLARGTHDVYVWGWAKFGQFGGGGSEEVFRGPQLLTFLDDVLDERAGERVNRVVCGSRHTALLTSAGRVLTMGLLAAPPRCCSSSACAAATPPKTTTAVTSLFVPVSRPGQLSPSTLGDDDEGDVDGDGNDGVDDDSDSSGGVARLPAKRKRTVVEEWEAVSASSTSLSSSSTATATATATTRWSVVDIASSAWDVGVVVASVNNGQHSSLPRAES